MRHGWRKRVPWTKIPSTNTIPTLNRRRMGAWAAWARFMALVVFCSIFASRPAEEGPLRGYELAPGDRITVVVFGQQELSGDFLVDSAGNILMPLVGSIEVKDSTIPECQQRISERLADGILKQPSVSVRILEPRPIYVLGDVKNPGSYSYRYGTTVKSALALAGGFTRADRTLNEATSDFIVADERVRTLNAKKLQLLLQQARLAAQRDGDETFTPPVLVGVADEGSLAAQVAAEKEIFAAQTKAFHGQLDLLKQQKPRLQSQIEAVNAQLGSQEAQLALVKAQLSEYGELMKMGLGRRPAEIDMKLGEARQQSELWKLKVELSHLQNSAGELDLKIQTAEADYRKQVLSELQNVREQLHEIDVTLPAAQEIRQLKRQQTGGTGGDREDNRVFTITRARGGDTMAFRATEDTLLEPGDTLEIKKLQMENGGSPEAKADKQADVLAQ